MTPSGRDFRLASLASLSDADVSDLDDDLSCRFIVLAENKFGHIVFRMIRKKDAVLSQPGKGSQTGIVFSDTPSVISPPVSLQDLWLLRDFYRIFSDFTGFLPNFSGFITESCKFHQNPAKIP